MTVTITERGWRCLNLGCPTREPVRAAEPPKCYTCERPMAEVHYPVTEKEIGRLAAAIESSRPAVVDFGSNPTADEYVKALAAFRSPPDDLVEPSERWQTMWRAARDSRVRSLARAFPYGYDVVDEAVGRASYDDKQRPMRTTSVGIDDRGRLSLVRGTQVHQEVERHLRIGDAVSVGYDVRVEPAYRCTRAGCPAREPVRASSPPTCYTCQQPMSAVADFTRPAPVPGIAAEIEFFKRRLASAFADVGMPAALLLGGTAAGLGASGEADTRFFYDQITQHQARHRERGDNGQFAGDWFLPADAGAPLFPRDLHGYGYDRQRPDERARPVGVPTTLDGERITVRDGYFVPDGGVRLLVPSGDWVFWERLAWWRKSPHTIEWLATSHCPGHRAEFQAIESMRRIAGNMIEVCFRRIRPNLRPEEICPALAPDIAAMRDEVAAPGERLEAARRLLEQMPSDVRFDELRDEIRACLTGLPVWWCACERAVIRAGAADVELLLDQDRFAVRVTPTLHDHARMTEGAVARYYARAVRAALPDDAIVSVQIARQPLLDDPQNTT